MLRLCKERALTGHVLPLLQVKPASLAQQRLLEQHARVVPAAALGSQLVGWLHCSQSQHKERERRDGEAH